MILEGEIKDLKLDECYLSPICNITSIQIAVIIVIIVYLATSVYSIYYFIFACICTCNFRIISNKFIFIKFIIIFNLKYKCSMPMVGVAGK